jgi:hypothetical protein
VAKKSVKRALNLQDLLCLTIFIYIIYLPTILLRFQTARAEIYLFTTGTPYKINSRILVLASFGGRELAIQMSLPGDTPTNDEEEKWTAYIFIEISTISTQYTLRDSAADYQHQQQSLDRIYGI